MERSWPIPSPNFYMDWLICKAARQNGVGVLLNGYDGDTIISHGYELFLELIRKFRLISLYREVKKISDLRRSRFWGVIKKGCIQPLAPAAVISAWRFISRRNNSSQVSSGLKLNPSFSRRLGLEEHSRLQYEKEKSKMRLSPRLWHLENITSGMLTNAMDIYRIAADDASIDLRFPYFDRRLVEFCQLVPPNQKMLGGEDRSIMRRAMQGILPPIVRSRLSKGNLSVNFNKGIHDKKNKIFQDIFVNHLDLISQFVDIADLKRCIDKFKGNPLKSNTEAFDLFLVVVLLQWLKKTGIFF